MKQMAPHYSQVRAKSCRHKTAKNSSSVVVSGAVLVPSLSRVAGVAGLRSSRSGRDRGAQSRRGGEKLLQVLADRLEGAFARLAGGVRVHGESCL